MVISLVNAFGYIFELQLKTAKGVIWLNVQAAK